MGELETSAAVEGVLDKVKEVLSAAQDWEQKGKAILKQRLLCLDGACGVCVCVCV